jgi:predicted ferric reductase
MLSRTHPGMAAARALDPRIAVGALLTVYVAVALAPLAIAHALPLTARPFMDDLASGLAMAGFSMLLMEFITSGRFRAVSAPVGIDLMMRFHQLVARVLTVFLLLHPFLYTLPMTAARKPWDTDGALALGVTPWSLASGFAAWGLLAAVFGLALFRDASGMRYETWRTLHGLGAALIALFGLHHTLDAGRYAGTPHLAAFWAAAVALAFGALAWIHVVRPLCQLRRPWRLARVERIAERTWLLRVEPAGTAAFRFAAGQFAWVKFHQALFRITEHPFSISSSPGQLPALEFLVKESGDFTRTIGSLRAGTPAYVHGPHGNFTLAGRHGKGIVFIAGGVGIAPIMSMLRELRYERDPRPITLVYGNRVEAQIAFREELEAMRNDLRLALSLVLSEPPPGWEGARGQLDAPTLQSLLPREGPDEWLYIVCGPPAMIDAVEHVLDAAGVPLHQIVSERFRYEAGAPTRRERLMVRVCTAVVAAIAAGIVVFAAR